MPINKYFKGHGDEVMANMTKEYGPDKGKRVFYATANSRHVKPMFQGGLAVPDMPNVPITDDPELAKKRREEEIARMLGGVSLQPPVESQPGVPPVPGMTPPPEPQGPATPPPEPTSDLERMVQSGNQSAPNSPPDMPMSDMERMVQSGNQSAPDSPPAVPAQDPSRVQTTENGNQPTPISGAQITGPEDEATPPTIGKAGTTAMGPLRNQESMTDQELAYTRKILQKTDPVTGKPMVGPDGQPVYKKPNIAQNILGQLMPRFDFHPNLTREYQNLHTLNTAATAERQAQIAQATEETRRLTAEAQRIKAEKDRALAKAPTKWSLLAAAANSSDPDEAAAAAKTLKLAEDSDIRTAGARAGAGALGRLEAGRNAPDYIVKPNSAQWRVAQDMAYGKIDMGDFQRLYSRNMDSGMKVAIYDQARQMNPQFDPKAFEAGYKVATTPNVVSQLSAIDNVVADMGVLLDASDLAIRTGLPLINGVVNRVGYEIGGQKYSDFNTARTIFADELSIALGLGANTDMMRDLALAITDPKLSPENFQHAMETKVIPMLQNRRTSITRPMGPYANRVPPIQYTPRPNGPTPPPAPAPPPGALNPDLRAPASSPAPTTTPAPSGAPAVAGLSTKGPDGYYHITLTGPNGPKDYAFGDQATADQILGDWRAQGGR